MNLLESLIVFYSPGLKRTTWLTVLGTNVSQVKQAIPDNPWAQCGEISKNLIDIFRVGRTRLPRNA